VLRIECPGRLPAQAGRGLGDLRCLGVPKVVFDN